MVGAEVNTGISKVYQVFIFKELSLRQARWALTRIFYPQVCRYPHGSLPWVSAQFSPHERPVLPTWCKTAHPSPPWPSLSSHSTFCNFLFKYIDMKSSHITSVQLTNFSQTEHTQDTNIQTKKYYYQLLEASFLSNLNPSPMDNYHPDFYNIDCFACFGTLHKWNHTEFTLLWFVYFTRYQVCAIHLCCVWFSSFLLIDQ